MRIAFSLWILALVALPVCAEEAPEFSAEQLEFFEKEVRPLLVERCHKCHSATEQKGNLRLDSRAAVLAGGDTGPAIDAAKPQASELLRAINYDADGYQMPPDGKLPDAEIAVLTRWVEAGAPWPKEAANGVTDPAADWETEFARRMAHWSFQPLVRQAVPPVDDAAWCRNAIDRFVGAKRQAAGLTPADEADRRTWLRRVYFDVIGLPPSRLEVEEFVSDAAPGAHERVIDRLLASPHFGERWGRHWLDLVRYAESRGHEFDYDVANPWPYRDYVVRAINGDVPYDQFVVEHVAGDLLLGAPSDLPVGLPFSRDLPEEIGAGESADVSWSDRPHGLRLDPATGANESIVATGFWFLGEWVHSPVDIRQDEADRFENMIDVYSKSFLGLTVACARCHDHKFDPIPQRDFYALQGYLQSSSYRQVRFEHWENNRDIAEKLSDLDRTAAEQLLPVFKELTSPTIERLDQILLACHDVLRNDLEKTEGARNDLQAGHLRRIRELAEATKLDPAILERWCSHLLSAAGNPSDPFHVWALYSVGELADPAAVTERLWPKNETPDDYQFSNWLSEAYAQGRVLDLDEFQSDGIGYRHSSPTMAVVQLGSDSEAPLLRIEEGGHIAYVSTLGESAVATEAMQDAGRLGTFERGGRTLRSATFDVNQQRVCCMIRGGCFVYLSVDSHVLVHGPLHGSLLQEFSAPNDESEDWRWIELDVSRYRGHRAHLEFVPRRGEAFAIRDVILADQLPGDAKIAKPTSWHGVIKPSGVFSAKVETKEDIASAYRGAWATIPVCIDFYLPREGGGSGFCYLATAEWARQHPQLFGLDSVDARRQFAAVAQRLIDRRKQLLAEMHRESALAPAMLDGTGEDEFLFIRGNWTKNGGFVRRRFLTAFQHRASVDGGHTSMATAMFGEVATALRVGLSTPPGSGRLQLAEQMVDPQQTPIVARVIVNRIWQHYFGRGIVPTPDDFGHLGLPPSHPELLDWLASELIAHDWSLKHIHRLILESSTYRMASEGVERRALSVEGNAQSDSLDAQPSTITDPANTLLARMNVKRLEGEIIRDALLATSGRLDDRLYGPSVPVHLTPFMEGRGRPGESGPVDGRGRRSLYIAVRRNFPDPFFQAFDFPNPHSTIGRRNVSNVPAQALAMLNNPLVIEQCGVAARRLLAEAAGRTVDERIEHAYLTTFGRPPTDDEISAGREFIASSTTEGAPGLDEAAAWADYLHVLVNAKEFLFIR